MENMYDLDIALQIIARMEAIKSKEFDVAVTQEDKDNLQRQIDMLLAEEKALYKNDNFRLSVIDKAFRLYAPILKKQSKVEAYEFA